MPPKKAVRPNARGVKQQPKKTQVGNQQQLEKQNIQEQDMNEDDYDQIIDGMKVQFKQENLTEQQLNEDQPTRMLIPNNPQAPKNITTYDQFQRKYKTDELVDQMTTHFSIEGDIIWKESNEYKVQEEIEESRVDLINKAIRQQEAEDPGAAKDIESIKQSMRNKFNYNARECQTINNVIRDKAVSTEPPASDQIRGYITQWEIFDCFFQDLENRDKELLGKKKDAEEEDEKKQESSLYAPSFKRCAKIMERMVVQNDQDEKYSDYKYYWTSNENQESGKTDGHMLPIWRFSNEKQRKKNVTSIAWNPRYPDLFALSLGSYDFQKQRMGLICLYSLKNTTHPEYSYSCEAGVMCLDFHPTSASLLAVGLYDGTVLVYDIRNKHKRPIYQSTVRNKKHTDPVWQVRWNPDTSKNYNFYSVSSDGRIMNWILMKNKLEPEEVILLRLVGKNDEESTLIGLACGLCFDFNKFEPHIFIVGTEEGKIHKCSRAYSGQYQENYIGHLLAVYKVRWNNYHPRTFISASADWTVRIWDSKWTTQIMCFDQGMQVVDAVWAPYSSTVFACAILDRVFVYDLNVDKHGKLSEQKPVKQPKLTNLAFNYRDPILLVGDTHGGVTLVKLSPNLTKSGKDMQALIKQYGDEKKIPDNIKNMTLDEWEKKKMEDLLSVVTKWERDDVQD